jgi:hypothetical protein
VDEVAATAVVEVDRVDAETIHLGVALVDKSLAFAAQRREVPRGDDAFQDEEAFVLELTHLV